MMNRIFEIKNVESCFVKSKTGPNILTNKKFSEPAQNFVHFYQFMNHYSTKYREYLNQKHSSNHLSDNIQNDKNEILRNENNNKEMSQKKFDSIELKDELSIQLRITNSDNNNKSISLVSPIIKKLKTQNVVSFPEEENENSFHEIMAGVNQHEYENKSSDFSIYEEEENHNDCYDKSKETMTIEGLNNNDSISLQNNKDDIIMEDENQPVDISDKMPNLTNSADSGNINSVHLTKSLSNIPLNSENIETIQLPKRNKKKTRKSSLEILKKEKSKKNRRHIKKIFCSDMSSDTLHINEYDKYTYLNSEKTQLELNDDGNFINNHEPFSYILPSIETGSYQNTSVMNLEDRNIMSTNLESQYIKMNINKQVKCEKEHHNESESVTDLNQYFDPNEKEFFFQQMSDDTSYNQEEKKTNFFQESDLTKNPTKKGKKIVLAKKVMRINKNEIHKYIDQESTENKSPIRCKVSIISKNDYLALKNENELMSDTSSINLMDEDHNISIHKPNKEEQTEKEYIEKEQREKEKIEKKQIEEEQKKKEQKDKEQKEKEQKEKEQIEKKQKKIKQKEKEQKDKEQKEKEQKEKEQIEKKQKKKKEKEQKDKEQKEKEQIETKQIETKQKDKEQKEKEQIEKEQKEKEQKDKEQIETKQKKKKQIKKEQKEKEQKEKEQIEKEQKEKEQKEKEQKEKEQKEKEQKEKEKKQKKKIKQKEKEQKEKEQKEIKQKEKEQKEKEQMEKEQKEKEQMEKEQKEKEQIEKKQKEKEQKEKEQKEKEQKEKEQMEKEQKEKEQKEKEQKEKEQIEKKQKKIKQKEKEQKDKEQKEKEQKEKEQIEKKQKKKKDKEQKEKEQKEKEQKEKEKKQKKIKQKEKEQKEKEQKEKEQKEKEHIKILSQIDQKKSDLKSKQKNKKAENRIKKKNHKQKKNKNPIIMTSNDSNKIESFNGENNKLLNDNISEISKNTMIHDMAVKTEKEMKKKNSFPKNISTKPPKKDRKHKHSKKHSNRKKQDTDTSSELESLDQGFEIKSFNITYMDLKENETPNEINLHKNTTKDNDDSLKTLVSNLQQSNNDMITSNRSDDNNNKGEKLFQDNIYSKFTKLSIKEKAGIIQFNSFQTNDEQTSSINTSLPANPNHHYYSKPDEQSMTVPSQLPVRRNVRKTNRRFPDAVRH